MNSSNRPITSREYKLMLNTDRFKDREEGIEVFLRLIEFLIKKEGGTIKKIQNKKEDEEIRLTSYLDTPELALRQQGYSLRLRDEDKAENNFQINLKYRSSDRYIAAARDLSCTYEKNDHKFEEDILPPFVSKFSHSTSIKTSEMPDLNKVKKLVALFPGLKELPIDEKTEIKTINDFQVYEVVRKLCQFRFGEELLTIKACLSFWYFTDKMNDWPLVGEFSFDYDLPEEKEESNGENLEMYPSQTVEGANRLFGAVQSQAGWINFNTTTKTAFALEVL